jgi:ribonucleoside-diphosphate reductase alpha subunit
MSTSKEMCVTKRSGELQEIAFDKILTRVKKLGKEGNININFSSLCLKVIDQLYDGIPTTKIDELTAEQCASMITQHYDYGDLAARISISNLQKSTKPVFSETMKQVYEYGMLAENIWRVIDANKEVLDLHLNTHMNRDYLLDYFGFKTLERAYLMRIDDKIVETPQFMWMRVALGIHGSDLNAAFETYGYMSQLMFTHATPTLFNAATPRPQLSSCFLLTMKEDSINGIYDTLKNCALISKWAGGIGLDINAIRAKTTRIKGTNGTSNGLVPMLRVFNASARYVDQGGGKRQGSWAMYLEPHHADIEDFLELRKNHGDEELKARDLFYALWISDYFMKCVKEDKDWYLFCPHECPGLNDVYGLEYEVLYKSYVNQNKEKKVMKARELWYQILDSQMETGTPYMLYKDHCNEKSNQKNLGMIRSSNLCTEIVEYTSPEETAVCNLASVALPKFVRSDGIFDHAALHRAVKILTKNLNKVIDINYYPIPETHLSNMLHRPIGIGVQGLADTFFKMNIAFESDEAKAVNKAIFETIYHAALEQSNELAKERKAGMQKLRAGIDNDYVSFKTMKKDCKQLWILPSSQEKETYEELTESLKPILHEMNALKECHLGAYSSFEGSPASEGILQFDMWGVTPSDRYDWDTLKESIMDHGLRNSLLVAPMPTASTAQILGNNEAFEPITSNIYSRRTNAGEFVVVNKYLMRELIQLGLWSEQVKDNIIKNRGSIQHIEGIPDHIKEKYKIVWEMSMKNVIDMAADRGAFICQSQSMNLWLEDPNYQSMTAMHFHSWEKGLKTGMYYLRRKPKHQPQQFTIEPDQQDEVCEMCAS